MNYLCEKRAVTPRDSPFFNVICVYQVQQELNAQKVVNRLGILSYSLGKITRKVAPPPIVSHTWIFPL